MSEPRTHANQTRPTTHMQPAADCGQQTAVVTHPASNPSKSPTRLPVISHQPTTTPPLHPSTTGRTQVAVWSCPDARAWCLGPDSLLDLDWDLDLGRLKIGTANTGQLLSKCTQSQSEFAWDISFVGCRRPIATTLPWQNMAARLDLYASSQLLSKPSPRSPAHPGQRCASSAQIDFFRVPA